MTNPFSRMGTVQAGDPAFPTVTLGFAAAGGTPSGSVPGVEQSRDQDLIEDVTDANDGRLVVIVSVSAVSAALSREPMVTDLMSASGSVYELTRVEANISGRWRLFGDRRTNLTMRADGDVT
jgi:hypothetical protein